jgi:glutamate 5-kinase
MKIVIKVGTSTLAHAGGHLNIRRVEELCKVMSDLKNAGHELILVSSGAIGMGVGKLSLKERPADMPTKQAAAAVGQCELMYTYDRLFSEYNHTVAQILITAADVNHGERHENFRNTLNRLLELGVLPIINENDSIATEEIVIGDNDTLAAMVAVSANAELLILLSDIDGLYTADPHKDPEAKLIETVTEIDDKVMALGGDKGSSLGTGGMRTKLIAAKIATDAGCDMIIANGSVPMSLYDMAEGKPVGTRFVAKKG